MNLTENQTSAVALLAASDVTVATLRDGGYSANSASSVMRSLKNKGAVVEEDGKLVLKTVPVEAPAEVAETTSNETEVPAEVAETTSNETEVPAEVAETTSNETEVVPFTVHEMLAYAHKRGDHRGWPTVAALDVDAVIKIIKDAKTRRGAINKMAKVAHFNFDQSQAA